MERLGISELGGLCGALECGGAAQALSHDLADGIKIAGGGLALVAHTYREKVPGGCREGERGRSSGLDTGWVLLEAAGRLLRTAPPRWSP